MKYHILLVITWIIVLVFSNVNAFDICWIITVWILSFLMYVGIKILKKRDSN